MKTISDNLRGVGFLILGMLIFSLQDIAVKWIGGNYPVLEIVTFRSFVALPLTLLFFRAEGGKGVPTTQQHKLEYLRGLCYFLSYTTHFMGLAALPLAEIAAIKFSGPLMIPKHCVSLSSLVRAIAPGLGPHVRVWADLGRGHVLSGACLQLGAGLGRRAV